MTPPDRAFFLVAHGSRDPRSQDALGQWKHAFQERLVQSGAADQAAWVRAGTLEFAEQPLAEQLVVFAHLVSAQGIQTITVLPLFLLAGVHVLEDIPAAVILAQHKLGNHSQIQLTPHFGSHPQIAELLRQTMQHQTMDRWILLSHGTRRPEGRQTIEAIAAQLGTLTAYWSQLPSLRDCLSQIRHQSLRIGIFPYFLCAGSILDAISAEIYRLKSESNKFDFWVAPPLQPNAIASQFLIDLCTSTDSSFNSAPFNSLLASI
jgi:sirohydrochlorin cobaltochelatase